MQMSRELWDSLEAIEESINKIVCLKQVLTLHSISNPDMMEILEALITEFSDKQKEVWNQVRKVCLENDELIEQLDKYKSINDEHIALEKRYDDLCEKYDKLAFYDSYREDSGFSMNMNNPTPSDYMNNDTIKISSNSESTNLMPEISFYNAQD